MSTISQQVVEAIEDSISRGLFQDQPIDYDVAMVAMPGPQGEPRPMLGLSFTIQAVDLAQGHAVMFLLPPVCPPQEEVDNMLRKIVQGMVNTKMQQAAEAMVAGNGHKDIPPHVSKSGLILPGQG
jgi:hypothetical protein